jgi:hypothetical protein
MPPSEQPIFCRGNRDGWFRQRSVSFHLASAVPNRRRHGLWNSAHRPNHRQNFQKARQLADYCDPVILAITVPEIESGDVVPRGKRPEVDLQQLGGMVTVSLPMIRQLSAVFLSLWNVEPAEARTGIRLANVFLVERPGHQTVFPRVRLLILNPAAGYPLCRDEIDTFKKLL